MRLMLTCTACSESHEILNYNGFARHWALTRSTDMHGRLRQWLIDHTSRDHQPDRSEVEMLVLTPDIE